MTTDMFRRETTWDTGQSGAPGARYGWQIWVGAACAALLLLALVFWGGYRTGQAPLQAQIRQLQGTIADQHAQLAALQGSQPICSEDGSQIQQAGQLLRQGKPVLAAQIAQLALQDQSQPPCNPARVTLATLVYQATLDDLFSSGANPADLGYAAMLTWQGAERRADRDHVPASSREGAITVAGQAYNAHQWLLARAAFLQAWRQGTVTAADLDQVRFYDATLRNLGRAQLPNARGQGLVTLATANAINQVYNLGQGEAHQDLINQLGTNTKRWPKPVALDPVLAAGRRG